MSYGKTRIAEAGKGNKETLFFLHGVGGIDDLVAIGWGLESESALQDLVNHISLSGVVITQTSDELCTKRSVKKAYLCTDPNGVTHELYVGAAIAQWRREDTSFLPGHFMHANQ
ncbi:MAG: hypothetical protein V7682_01120 [Cycloclasticus sp.]